MLVKKKSRKLTKITETMVLMLQILIEEGYSVSQVDKLIILRFSPWI